MNAYQFFVPLCTILCKVCLYSFSQNKILISISFFPRKGFFFGVYDLSTSGKCGTNYVIPAIRIGHLRVRVVFSEALPIDLTMLLYCEFPATLYVGKTGKLGGSYL